MHVHEVHRGLGMGRGIGWRDRTQQTMTIGHEARDRLSHRITVQRVRVVAGEARAHPLLAEVELPFDRRTGMPHVTVQSKRPC